MEIYEQIKLLKALADTSRLVILNSLIEKPQYVEELSQRLDLAASTISFHLKKLEEVNLVYKIKEQYYVIFYINKKIFDSTLKDLTSFSNLNNILHEERIKKYKERIIKTYFIKNKLFKIPVQYKKRLVVLEEICKSFKTDRIYSENEVDEIISGIFEDYCTVRRQLLEYKFFHRNKGNYQLTNNVLDNHAKIFINQKKSRKNNTTMESNTMNEVKEKMEDRKATKKELKNAYKLAEKPMGIYQFKNLVTGKILIGSSKDPNGTSNRIKFCLKFGFPFGNFKGDELQNDWNKYGENNFSFEMLDNLKPKDDPLYNYDEELKTLLELWVEKLQPFGDKGYHKN